MSVATGYRVEGLVQWRSLTDYKAFQVRLNRNLARATKLNAVVSAKKMRETIQSGNFKPNAPLTIAIKGSAKPLVAGGDLFQSISVQEVPGGYFVGVLRTEANFDVVKIVHDGATIQVTPAMRWMFMLLSKASKGEMDAGKLEGRAAELFAKNKNWKPLADSTTAIVIPERPFVRVTFARPDLAAICKKNWAEAIQSAMFPKKRGEEGKLSKLARRAEKLGKKASKLSKKAEKAGKKLGKKGLKAGKKLGKKGLKAGRRLSRSAVKRGRKLARGAGKRLRGAKKSVKKFGKGVKKRFRSKGKRRKK